MAAGAILLQFANLLKHAESLGPKLSSNIRPNKDQLKEFQSLYLKLKEATAGIEVHVERMLQKARPKDKDINLLHRLRSSETVDQLDPSLTIALRKNLCLIFRGPDVSALDTEDVKRRKDKTRARCEKLRAQAPPLILRWSMMLQPSTWNNPSVMTDSGFEYLIDELRVEKFSPIPPKILECMGCLKEEEPLKSCELFQKFVDEATQMTAGHETPDAAAPPRVITNEHHQQDAVSHKRKHITEDIASGGTTDEVDDTQEKIKLIKRTDEIDYKGSSMPASNFPLLVQRLQTAMESSKQWKWERQLFENNVMKPRTVGIDRTDCLNIFVPKDRNHDVSVTLLVGYEAGLALIYETGAQIIRV